MKRDITFTETILCTNKYDKQKYFSDYGSPDSPNGGSLKVTQVYNPPGIFGWLMVDP